MYNYFFYYNQQKLSISIMLLALDEHKVDLVLI